ncbi:unnamed protein product, partial [Closterium sp. NIES-53]
MAWHGMAWHGMAARGPDIRRGLGRQEEPHCHVLTRPQLVSLAWGTHALRTPAALNDHWMSGTGLRAVACGCGVVEGRRSTPLSSPPPLPTLPLLPSPPSFHLPLPSYSPPLGPHAQVRVELGGGGVEGWTGHALLTQPHSHFTPSSICPFPPPLPWPHTDRYVWNWVEGEWRAALVILRLNRAALCVAWSPQENKFAVGSGSKTVSVCYYDDENSWWVSKVIRKKHASSVTSVAWHPNNLLLATTCTDNKCRIFSATIKGVDSKSAESSSSGGFSGKFGEQLLQLDLAFGWTFGARWSPSGANLAFVGHDSTIHFINDVGPSLTLHSISLRYLPLRDVLFLSDRLLVAAGFDYNPILFSADANGTWTFVRVLDGSEEPTSTATGAALSAKDTFGRSMERGNSLRSSLNDAAPNAPSIPDSELSKGPSTVHQDCITCIRPLGSADDSIIQQFSTS